MMDDKTFTDVICRTTIRYYTIHCNFTLCIFNVSKRFLTINKYVSCSYAQLFDTTLIWWLPFTNNVQLSTRHLQLDEITCHRFFLFTLEEYCMGLTNCIIREVKMYSKIFIIIYRYRGKYELYKKSCKVQYNLFFKYIKLGTLILYE